MKICPKCRVLKNESEFHKNKSSKDGLNNYCKQCRKKSIDRKEKLCECGCNKVTNNNNHFIAGHNLINGGYRDVIEDKYVCFRCKKEKELTEFYARKNKKKLFHGVCKDCMYHSNKDKIIEIGIINTRLRQHKYRDIINNYKTSKGCSICGIIDFRVLDLDHIKTNNKSDTVSNLIHKGVSSLNRIIDEINKCDVKCANCHRKKTLIEEHKNTKERFLNGTLELLLLPKNYLDKKKMWANNRVIENKIKVYSYLQLHPCVDCGDTDIRVLEFDHRIDSNKKKNITALLQFPKNIMIIFNEIEKCEVRCANCHRIKTYNERMEITNGS